MGYTIGELVRIVCELNDHIYDVLGDAYYVPCELRTNGNTTMVTFEGLELWSSEDDTRLTDEHDEVHESMEACIRRRLKEELAKMTLLAQSFNSISS